MNMKINYPIPKKMSYSAIQEAKKNKYKNVKVTIDGIDFPSKKEGNRYLILKDKQNNGEITNLRLQVKFELQPSFKINGKAIKAINYIADFTYYDKDKFIVEDTKGMRTQVYKLKAKIFAYKYGYEIKEI